MNSDAVREKCFAQVLGRHQRPERRGGLEECGTQGRQRAAERRHLPVGEEPTRCARQVSSRAGYDARVSFAKIARRGVGSLSFRDKSPGEVHGPSFRRCRSSKVVCVLGRGLSRCSFSHGSRRSGKEVFEILTRTVAAEVALFTGEGSLNTRRCKASEGRPQFLNSRMFTRRR